ncbi:MFS transporter [Amylibacter ulvae]|uniref:MFS transporter n=1 Tax=Paramylibacter ulvae TaxID=1651968 RepID=A0ABQ3CWN6_9RHOB|nr:MFS transporter [Amylibacter ulvae]GHA45895.1 MFS transporter [Amylibacter ulvae]
MNLAALRHSDFRLYFLGGACAVNGMWILRVVIGWLAWDLTHSASFVGLIASLSMFPTLFSGPFFGVWVDRGDIKLANYLTNIGMMCCTFALLLANLLGFATPILLSAVALAVGIVASAHHPVRLSMAPRLVGREDVSSVVALAAINFNVARLIGPAIGGVLIDLVGIPLTLSVTLILYLPSLAIIHRLQPRNAPETAPESFFSAFRTGIKYIANRPSIISALVLISVMSFCVRGIMEILPVIADGVFERGAVGFGQMTSAIGAGSLCCALLKGLASARPITVINPVTIIIAAFGIVFMGVVGNTQSWTFAIIAVSVLGFCTTYVGVTLQASIQTDLPDNMRGRVMSIWVVVAMSVTAMGAVALGASAQFFSIPATTFATTMFGLTALIAIAAFYYRARKRKLSR